MWCSIVPMGLGFRSLGFTVRSKESIFINHPRKIDCSLHEVWVWVPLFEVFFGKPLFNP